MGRYIDWYLVELESCIEGGMGAERAHQFLAEAEAHLTDAAEQFRSSGMGEKESELAAVERFGSARKIAERAIGAAWYSKALGKVLLALSFAGFACLLAMFQIGPTGIWPDAPVGFSLLWACIVLFALGSALVQRVLWRPLLALSTLACAGSALFAGIVYPQGMMASRSTVADNAEALRVAAGQVPEELGRMSRARKTLLPPDSFQIKVKPDSSVLFAGSDSTRNRMVWDTESGETQWSAEKQWLEGTTTLLGGRSSSSPCAYPVRLGASRYAGSTASYADFVQYAWTDDRLKTERAWKNRYEQLAAELRRTEAKMDHDAKDMAELASGSIWMSAASHWSLAAVLSGSCLVGGLILNAVFTLLPLALTGRPRRLRRYA